MSFVASVRNLSKIYRKPGTNVEVAALRSIDLDLVEVAPTARPPVCKLMDYGKYKYESAQKARASRRNQQQTVIKEMKLRPKIDKHDYETKKGHIVRFLTAGDKVNRAPRLKPLGYYGGFTPTFALKATSPAVNKGSCVTATDQRGVARPQGPACDIGAFEREAP